MPLRFGLTEEDIAIITDLLSREPHVERAYIFGSRAKGNYKTGSDVDIALKGEQLTSDDIRRISDLLNEETNLPYRFDVLNYHALQEPALVEHIDHVGLMFYEKVSQRFAR
ncbi:MAG: nucleotidyltransferase domain-containing protein [Saprospiraceae bacterium]|nr:nucleotidyltransferase domain-containing protein [Saprospiraceae bacterium]MDW8228410.1 nucleotidyltransferase domain-containing protein [Saprospiraceae bacterium]MDW8484400.1 nucleotidyltransferase domain-containing protein [Saprospiraceae bacterium]